MKKFMQDFWAVFEKDIQSEGFTLYERMTFGIIVPALFVAVCVAVEMIGSRIL